MIAIGPSMMCGDLGRLREEIRELDRAGVDFFHFDVMDGHFVPNLAFSADVLRWLRKDTQKPFDVHLMVEKPEYFIDMFADAGADWISFHVESSVHVHRALDRIRNLGLRPGVALKPSTPLALLEYILTDCSYVCVMSVDPGFAGQRFIPAIYGKIRALSNMVEKASIDCEIQVDGNVGENTIPGVVQAGASLLVCGTSSIFRPLSDRHESVAMVKRWISVLDHQGPTGMD